MNWKGCGPARQSNTRIKKGDEKWEIENDDKKMEREMTGRGHGYNCENDHVLISCILIVRFMHEQFWNANYYPENDQNDQDYDYDQDISSSHNLIIKTTPSPVVERPTARSAECPPPQMFSMQLISVNERSEFEKYFENIMQRLQNAIEYH